MKTVLGNDKGSVAIIGSIIVLAAVAAYSMNAFQAGDQSAKQYIKISKEKDIQQQLFNIGEIIKNVGLPIFTGLTSSGLFEIIKPFIIN